MPASEPLTNPLDALVLPRVLRWVAVVFRQRTKCGHLDRSDGRPWTRLPAKDLAAQLEREEGLEVSVRRVQRSLERLVEDGHLARCQRTKWWGQRDYWYSWSDAEWELQQHRPTALFRGGSASVTPQSGSNRRPEASAASVQVLSTPLHSQTTEKTERETASRFDEESPCVPLQGAGKGGGGPVPAKASKPTSQRRLGAAEALNQVVRRAAALGFGASKPVGTEGAEGKRWVEDGFVYTLHPSGHLLKDSVATAPIR